MNNWPVNPVIWTSSFDSLRPEHYLISKKHEGILENHHCRVSWELSQPFIKNKRNAIDIGCRDGEFTYYLQRSFEHVYAFDYRPSPHFHKNITNTNVTLFNCALGATVENVMSGGGGQLENLATPAKNLKKLVTVYPLDLFNLTDVDYIKIDTDGYEMKIIKGAEKTLTNNNPVIVIEQGYFDKKEAMQYCIENLGYKHVATCPRNLDYILVKE